MRWYDTIMNNLRTESSEKTEELIRDMTIDELARLISEKGKVELVVDFNFGKIFQECTVEQIATWLKKESPFNGIRKTITKEEADL